LLIHPGLDGVGEISLEFSKKSEFENFETNLKLTMLALLDGTNSCPAGSGLNPKNKKFLMADFDAADALF